MSPFSAMSQGLGTRQLAQRQKTDPPANGEALLALTLARRYGNRTPNSASAEKGNPLEKGLKRMKKRTPTPSNCWPRPPDAPAAVAGLQSPPATRHNYLLCYAALSSDRPAPTPLRLGFFWRSSRRDQKLGHGASLPGPRKRAALRPVAPKFIFPQAASPTPPAKNRMPSSHPKHNCSHSETNPAAVNRQNQQSWPPNTPKAPGPAGLRKRNTVNLRVRAVPWKECVSLIGLSSPVPQWVQCNPLASLN